MTDYGLAHWIAQSFDLDLNNLPKRRPEHITKEAYDSLRDKVLKDYIFRASDQIPPEQLIVENFNH